MRVIGIARVGNIFPDIGAGEAFALEFGDEFVFLHGGIVAQYRQPMLHHRRQRPPCRNGGCCRKGAPSSGEKIVVTKSYSPGGGVSLSEPAGGGSPGPRLLPRAPRIGPCFTV